MKIAAQLYTLREYLKTPADVSATLKKVKQIGYNAVQVSGLGPIDSAALKDIVEREGLTICATHIGYQDLWGNLDKVIEKHKLWNCRYVGLGSMPEEYRGSREGYVKFAKEASEVGRRLKQAGLTFIYHNHSFEFEKFGGVSAMEILLQESDPEAFDFELDVHWVQAGGAEPAAWIELVKGRMRVVHLKDMVVTREGQQLFAEVGEGNMNFRRILDACDAIDVEWGAVEQDNCYGRDPFESLAISARNLRAMGAAF
jgi:sugar phosphate isomerase/epimerase